MSSHLDLAQAAVVLAVAMVHALGYSTGDGLVRMAVHI